MGLFVSPNVHFKKRAQGIAISRNPLHLRLKYETLASMDIVVLKQCDSELKDMPKEILEEVLDCVAKLRIGIQLTMPLSRPMPSLGKGVHELRIKDRSGQFRVIYIIKVKDRIYLVHAFKKTSEQTALRNMQTALTRIKKL